MIQTQGLQYQYAAGPRLSFADVDLPQGGQLLLQGRSGAGKSTWLALVAGLLTPTAGEILVAGQPLGTLSRSGRDRWRARAVGFLPQKLHLSEALTVEGNLALAWYAAGLPLERDRLHATLERLGVRELAGRKPSQLSVGQAQRVALARSVLLRPKVLLADEPSASLDDIAATAALALLREAAAECGATLVVATHDARLRSVLAEAQVLRLEAPA